MSTDSATEKDAHFNESKSEKNYKEPESPKQQVPKTCFKITVNNSKDRVKFPTLNTVLAKVEQAPSVKKSITLDIDCVSPTHFMTKEEISKLAGPVGWCGCDGRVFIDNTPEKALSYTFSVVVAKNEAESVQQIVKDSLLAKGLPSTTSIQVKQIQIGTKKVKSDDGEEIPEDNDAYYSDDEYHYVAVFDQVNVIFCFSLMNEEISHHIDSILNVLQNI